MFGYVRTDTPYLFIKDQTLYQAMYCGLCKGIAQECGHSARMGLSYDVTFLSVLLHNLKGVDVKIDKGHCLTHCIRSKKMAEPDEIMRQLGAFNTALAYYKCTDDILDNDGGRAKRMLFKKGMRRVKKNYPQIAEIVDRQMRLQAQTEKQNTDSIDRAADATACMLAEISDLILQDKHTQETHDLFYAIGKWIYLIDALDDYDKDKKKGAYNPFVLRFQSDCKAGLMQDKTGEEVRFAFHAIFFDIREKLSKLHFHFNRDLSDNILLRGLPAVTEQVCNGLDCKGCKKHKKEQK